MKLNANEAGFVVGFDSNLMAGVGVPSVEFVLERSWDRSWSWSHVCRWNCQMELGSDLVGAVVGSESKELGS